MEISKYFPYKIREKFLKIEKKPLKNFAQQNNKKKN